VLQGTKKVLHLHDLARHSNGPLKGYGHCKGSRPDTYAFQALVAEVEVERETGQVRVQQLYFTVDATKIINPVIYQGQIDGAVTQGLGFSLIEKLAVEDGRVTTLSLGDYKIPNICDVPPLTTSRVQAQEGPGPFGAKAVAESGIGIVAPAIANAIYDATRVRTKELPITAEKVLEGLVKSES
jgi:CO/xanthine dehydrogenase Mo-binding subunit